MARSKRQAFKRVRGTMPMRQTLCCMFRFFVKKGHEEAFERVFSRLFRSYLERQYGKDKNLPIRTINTQWTWMRSTKSPVWKHVHIDTEFRLDAEWRTIIRRIKSTANYLNITLVEREEDAYRHTSLFDDFELTAAHLPEYLESVLTSDKSSDDASTSTRRESPDVAFSEVTQHTTFHENTEKSNSIQMEPDLALHSHADQGPLLGHQFSINHATEPRVHGYGKVCFWCYQEGELLANAKQIDHLQIPKHLSSLAPPEPEQTPIQSLESHTNLPQDAATEGLPGLCSPDDLPRLLYRWSNSESQGTNTATLFESGRFKNKSNIYRPNAISEKSFLDHFKNHVTKAQVATPFISMFAQPLAPIHRAIHQRKNAIVSIIDTKKLENPVFKAQILVPITDTATPCWKGYGEYEVWGRISAAVIVCTFPITALEAIRRREIREFLQLEVIKRHIRCNRYLYTDLASKLPPSKGKEYRPTLKHLAGLLGVPKDYRDLVAEGFEVAWTKGYRWPQTEDFRSLDEGNAATIVPQVTPEYDSDNSSFRPPRSESGSYVTSSSSDDNASSSESAEERCPRRDTPSDGFSVHDDSSVCSGQENVEVVFARPRPRPRATSLLTPPSTGRSRKKQKHVPKGAVPFKFNSFTYRQKQSTAEESDWPSDDA